MMQQLYVQETFSLNVLEAGASSPVQAQAPETLGFDWYTQTQREADRTLCQSYLKHWGQTTNRLNSVHGRIDAPAITLAQFQAAAERLARWADIELPN